MSRYKLNPKLENLSIEKIFNLLFNFIEIGKSYKTLSGRKKHKIVGIKGEVTIERLNATNQPVISFDEFLDVLALFKCEKTWNTSSKEYQNKLRKPIHKTPLLSILFASEIIVKIKK